MGSIFADVSVLVRQKKGRRRAPVGFRDNPELYSGAQRVRGQQAESVDEAQLVLCDVL